MIVDINTLWGKVTFDSPKVEGDFNINTITDKKKRAKLQSEFFPLETNDLDTIVFQPRNEKFDTQESRDKLQEYLKTEFFLKADGNFFIETALDLNLSPTELLPA